jgi:hypothetical protein
MLLVLVLPFKLLSLPEQLEVDDGLELPQKTDFYRGTNSGAHEQQIVPP